MPIDVLKKCGTDVIFTDYIEIFTSAVDSVIYSPVFDKFGLYLYSEGKKPISCMRILDSKLTFYYTDGEMETFDDLIIDLKLEESRFVKITGMSIQGNLLQYSINDALFYKLDVAKAFPEEIIRQKTKKRSI